MQTRRRSDGLPKRSACESDNRRGKAFLPLPNPMESQPRDEPLEGFLSNTSTEEGNP
jgi:hypothetical protein